jgi:hypothetical protein
MNNLYRGSPIDASNNVPSVGSFGKAVSEKKIVFLEINGSEKRMGYGGDVC